MADDTEAEGVSHARFRKRRGAPPGSLHWPPGGRTLSHQHKLRRYAALGVIAFTLAMAYGIWYAYSVILVALLAEFGWSRTLLAGAFSVFTLVHGGVQPVMGALCARVSPMRVTTVGGLAIGAALLADSFIASPAQLYLFFGVFTAVAVSAAGWVPALVHVQRHYQDRLALSIGIVSSGVGVGMLLVVPLMQALIDALGWRAAFRVLAVVCVAWIVPASLWLGRVRPENRGESPISQRQPKSGPGARRAMTLREATRSQPFWLLVAAFFFGNVCSQTLHVHQVAHLVDLGFSAIVAASVVGVVGLASIFGKTGGGWLADRIERERVYVAGVSIMVLAALALLALGGAPSPWSAYGYAVLLGVGYSVTAALTPVLVSDRFSGPHYGSIVGVGLAGAAFGSAMGPWLAGRLYDTTGTYAVAFLIAAACGVIALACVWRARGLRLKRHRPVAGM